MQNMKMVKKLLFKFYKSSFNATTADIQSMRRCLNCDVSVLILVKQIEQGMQIPKCLYQLDGSKIVVVGAVTFVKSHHGGENTNNAVSAFVSWLASAIPGTPAPKVLTGWRRNGFGIFLLVHVVKCCCASWEGKIPKTVSIYLQSTEAAAYHFYRACGFRQINSANSNGMDLLPVALQAKMDRGSSPFIPKNYGSTSSPSVCQRGRT